MPLSRERVEPRRKALPVWMLVAAGLCLLIALLLWLLVPDDDDPSPVVNSAPVATPVASVVSLSRPQYARVVADADGALKREAQDFVDSVSTSAEPANPAANDTTPGNRPATTDNRSASGQGHSLQGGGDQLLRKAGASMDDVLAPSAPRRKLRNVVADAGQNDPDALVYFVQPVAEDDDQGAWGLLQRGMVRRFAEGVAMSRGEAATTYRVLIPAQADEPLANGRSSFLGSLMQAKLRGQAWAVNRRSGTASRELQHLVPGEHVLVVGFTPDELVSVYEYFVRGGAGE